MGYPLMQYRVVVAAPAKERAKSAILVNLGQDYNDNEFYSAPRVHLSLTIDLPWEMCKPRTFLMYFFLTDGHKFTQNNQRKRKKGGVG